MLRITEIQSDDRQRLKLEGSLSGPWVDDLARLVESAGGVLELDLSEVRYVDQKGEQLLRGLLKDRVVLRNCSNFVAVLLGKECPS